MKCVIPAAGFGTRFSSVVPDTAKALVEINGKTVLDLILEKLEEVSEVDEIFVVSNAYFLSDFENWLEKYGGNKKVRVICDGALNDSERKGSVRAVKLALQFLKRRGVSDDLLVVYGDNLFSFGLRDFLKFFNSSDKSVQAVFDVSSVGEARKLGVYRVDSDNNALELLEKPESPPSTLCASGLYAFKRCDLKYFFEEYVYPELGVGHVFMRMVENDRVKVFPITDNWVDIGTSETYERALREF